MSRLVTGSWTLRRVLVCLTTLALAGAVSSAAAQTPSDGDPANPSTGGGAQITADGPFGRVVGTGLAVDANLPDADALEVLDAYGRGARVELRSTSGTLGDWRVTAYPEPIVAGAQGSELASGSGDRGATLRLPSSGLFLVRLDATIAGPGPSDAPPVGGSWVWRIAVPDRDIPPDGDPYPPAPAILLSSGDQSVALDAGSGCFVGTCGDIGATSPPRTLPTLDTLAGAPLTVRLSDVSGIAEWVIDATPIAATDEQPVTLSTGAGDPPRSTMTFAAPADGRWVILVHVRFDRERGSYDGYGRLILHSPDTASDDRRLAG